MREIKFRGKRLDNGLWAYGHLHKLHDGTCLIMAFGTGWFLLKTGEEIFQNAYIEEVDSETVGQYTGLKDKNDKEIYEGDIVQGYAEKQSMPTDNILLSEELKVNCRVKWSRYEAMFYFYCRELKRALSVIDEFFDYEIIGNIHDKSALGTVQLK